ncbi:glutathione S-transferase-like [Prorops nasuta]|uniref:glutathione S-transferase-like n=1 Tax=Prorops nasuta TaxID=863751 RepID=UPI0034CEE029
MTTYKLIYFNATGLGETIRFLLHHAGIKFEDERIEMEDWPKHKSNMPLGQVPVLEINGRKYYQSKAISRYISKKCNLYGSDDLEALEIDIAIDSIDDFRQFLTQYYWHKDPVEKERLKQIAMEKLPFYLGKFETQVKENGGYFVRNKLSYADFLYAGLHDLLTHILGRELNQDHPELKKLTDKVMNLPNVKAYIDTRPKTNF